MKKLVLLVLLSTALFAIDCSYWFKKAYSDITLLHLAKQDGDYSQLNELYRTFLESSRNVIAVCQNDVYTDDMFKLREDAKILMNKN